MLIALISWIITGSIFGFATNAIIKNKGYRENWFWWGFFFGFIAMLVAMSKPERVEAQQPQKDSANNEKKQVDQQEQSIYDSKVENEEEMDVLTIPIMQYNHAPKLKPHSLTCRPYQGQYAFTVKLKCFREKSISAVMMDIILHTTFGEIFEIKDIGFTNFEGTKYCMVSGITEYPLPQAQFILIKQADIIIKKYVEAGEMVELSEEERKLSPYEQPLEEELQKAYFEEELIQVAENLKGAIQIYEYLLKYNTENNGVLTEEFLEMIKKQAYIERMYGLDKGECIKTIKKYFKES